MVQYSKFSPILVLSRKDIEASISMQDAVEIVEDAFKELGLGNIEMPQRIGFKIPAYGSGCWIMPAYVGGSVDAWGTKILTINYDNPKRFNLPWTLGLMILADPKNGEFLAVMEGSSITALRTAACSAVATKYMSKKDAETVGLFGAGIVGRQHLISMCAVRDIRKAKVIDLPELYEKTKALCEEMSKKLEIEVVAATRAEEVIRGSDIICTVTTSPDPVFRGEWLEEGTHINAVGGAGIAKGERRRSNEIDEVTIKRARKPIIVDLKEHILKEGAQEISIPISKGLISESDICNLSDVVLGRIKGRTGDAEITLFKTAGIAIEDVATARKLYDSAISKGIGTTVAL